MLNMYRKGLPAIGTRVSGRCCALHASLPPGLLPPANLHSTGIPLITTVCHVEMKGDER